MSIAKSFLPEFDAEMAGLRRVLERAPIRDWAWQPHPKSYSLGQLANHLVDMVAWAVPTLRAKEFDMAPQGGSEWKPANFKTRKALLAGFDENVKATRKAIASTKDPAWQVPWTLRAGETVYFTMPRLAVFRSMILNHIIHHRAQMTVYLRLRDVAVPGMYGPSADEM